MLYALAANYNYPDRGGNRSTSAEAFVKERNQVRSTENYVETGWRGRRGDSFSVRRPLRYLAHNLDLDEQQRLRTVERS